MMSHALCQGCKDEYDMVLTLEVPTITLKRPRVTFLPLLTRQDHFYIDGT